MNATSDEPHKKDENPAVQILHRLETSHRPTSNALPVHL